MTQDLPHFGMYIDGRNVPAESGEWFETFNPFNGQPWALVAKGSAADVDKAVEAAHRALTAGEWAEMTATKRGALMRRLGDLIAENSQSLSDIEVRDNGKLLAEINGQISYIPQWYYYYGGLADKIEGAVLPIDKPDSFVFLRQEPIGVVAAITPWNSPLFLTTWKLAPALAAGCTVVIKPSEHTSVSVLKLCELIEKAGFPKGVVNVVTGFGNEVGEPLVSHEKVAKIAFTGGEAGGVAVHSAAARSMKSVTLELGGKSPNIIFDDADLEEAVKGAISGIFAASGQTCIAGSRLLVQASIYDRILKRLVEFAGQAKLGDPMELSTQVGPVTTQQQYARVLDYIGIAKDEGAKCALGGGPSTDTDLKDGWFVQPTIFSNVTNTMRIAREEVFGPVLSVIPFETEDDAIRIANDSPYGLAAGVWTSDVRRMLKMSQKLQAGTIWINTYRAGSFMVPFGGVKRSGMGRENGQDAIREFMQTKSVWISTAAETPNPFVMR
ncbi:aldehyde dehydrogenase [Roseovarius amoyensis]|uniref:aldehyde dehydrogenase n=1 Tax=Roseovarius amoyensis TaxID=2211448 RepID=UPI001EF75555|nr:aldehyde dehydrogenase [Roseovarius amoyensis]